MSAAEHVFERALLEHDRQWWLTELEKATDPFLRAYCQASLDAVVREIKESADA